MNAMLDEAVDLTRELVGFPTISTDTNLDLIQWAERHLTDLGFRAFVTYDETLAKANLFATIGPEGDGGVVLSGHSDVVPAEGDWTDNPFELTGREGNYYGRGACDMKGFIGCVLALAPRLAEARLSRPIHIALTHDEETGCLGAQDLVKELKARAIRPSIAVIGEPTMMRVIEGHKGCYEYTTSITGMEGHGSAPSRGVNAAEYAVRYVTRLMELAEELRARAPVGGRFQPPWTTMNIGRISGGVAHNVIAGHCDIDWEMRPVQNGDADFVKTEIDGYAERVLLPEMRLVAPDAAIERHTIGEVEGLIPANENEARDIVSALTGANSADLVAFGTEAGLFQALGMSCVVCGPGSIEQAHKPDEFVSAQQLSACLDMLEGLAKRVA